jgi:hypothetical protein
MIIFYNSKTGEIVGTIEGRVHTPSMEKVQMGIKDISITKLSIPYKSVEWVDQKLGKVKELHPDWDRIGKHLADLVLKHERRKDSLINWQFKFNKKGEIRRFDKRKVKGVKMEGVKL